MRREVLLALLAASLATAGCSKMERLTFVRPTADRGEYVQIAPTYDVSGRKGSAGAGNAVALVAAASDRLRRGELDEAERLSRQALKADPRSTDALTLLGSIAESRGRAAEAGRHYKAAVALAPGTGIPANNYGAWLCANGQAAQSLAFFDQALADPAYPTPLAALSNAGSCARKAGMAPRAEASWRQVLAAQPEHVGALAGMAQLQYDLGHTLEARAFAQRWLAVAPDDPDGLRLAIAIERKHGDNAAASRYLSRLQGISSGSTTSPPAR